MAGDKFMQIKYPSIRFELMRNLEKLSDLNYQNAVWVAQKYPVNIEFDSFDLVVHFIYDDTSLGEDASGMLGITFIDEAEVRAFREVVGALDLLFEKHGTNLSDRDYIHKPEWVEVVKSARQALAVMRSKQKLLTGDE